LFITDGAKSVKENEISAIFYRTFNLKLLKPSGIYLVNQSKRAFPLCLHPYKKCKCMLIVSNGSDNFLMVNRARATWVKQNNKKTGERMEDKIPFSLSPSGSEERIAAADDKRARVNGRVSGKDSMNG
jgi:hypothetical protein